MKKLALATGLTLAGGGVGLSWDILFPKEKSCMPTETDLPCVKLIKVIDGDTYKFNIPTVHPLLGKEISVRLKGIDTPEIHSENCEKVLALKAQTIAYTALEFSKRIDLKNIERDKYFRILADIENDGESLKDLLKEHGLAVDYDGKTKTYDWCNPNQN